MASKKYWTEYKYNIWSYKLGDFKRRPTIIVTQSGTTVERDELTDVFKVTKETLETKRPRKPHSNHHGIIYTAYADFSAGALGGGTATYTTHWLDTIKVKMQTFPEVHRSSFYCLRSTLKEDGLAGLYQGATPAVVGQMCKTAVVFMSYELCEELVRKATGLKNVEDETIWHHAGSGAVTGVMASFVLCPMELIKCRLQALKPLQNKASKPRLRTVEMIRETMRSEGLHGLYRGLPGIWAKEIPGSFIYFGSYESAKSLLKHVLKHDRSTTDLGTGSVFSCGVFAGFCHCITHPIESVKTRVQVLSAVSQTQGFFRAFWSIIKTEGVMPLCNGLLPCMIRAGLYSGIQFVTYEKVKEYFLKDP